MNKQIVTLYEFDKDLQDSFTGAARTSFGLALKFSAKANDEDTVQDHAKAIEALQHSLEMALEQRNSAVEFYNTAIERHQAALEHLGKQIKSTTADPEEKEDEEEENEEVTSVSSIEDVKANMKKSIAATSLFGSIAVTSFFATCLVFFDALNAARSNPFRTLLKDLCSFAILPANSFFTNLRIN